MSDLSSAFKDGGLALCLPSQQRDTCTYCSSVPVGVSVAGPVVDSADGSADGSEGFAVPIFLVDSRIPYGADKRGSLTGSKVKGKYNKSSQL